MILLYGSVPEGLHTNSAAHSGTAPALTAGLVSLFQSNTQRTPRIGGFFSWTEPHRSLLALPGLCESAFVGDVKPLKCGTKEPYSEPQDLEQFVRENRLKQ